LAACVWRLLRRLEEQKAALEQRSMELAGMDLGGTRVAWAADWPGNCVNDRVKERESCALLWMRLAQPR
jgi:hypothetical protein